MTGREVKKLLAYAAAMIVFACEGPVLVTRDYDTTKDFTRYTTFTMVRPRQKDQSLSQHNADQIINAVKEELIKKGFAEDISAPDLKVNVVTILTDISEVLSGPKYYGYGGVYRPYGWGTGKHSAYATWNVRGYTDGSLIIEIIDSRNDHLVWEGIGNSRIDSPWIDVDSTVPPAVSRIMKDFPPTTADKKNKKLRDRS
ncbi:DUF4136 domain-containing protein [Fulvivirgaceae bacterium PWU4]|uniref:DUF4136 domain-containing protein n=1 Tax=Chryseosolibacter histidini TaxID=2782349 RepID=A0AAP2DNF3_9BACT|nr:DUF4136 domain-containing protein [Chryseosolibacter histidini]MBT1699543.1 DUF4136 domain-containing protein [Chryseosolibacter histidini]